AGGRARGRPARRRRGSDRRPLRAVRGWRAPARAGCRGPPVPPARPPARGRWRRRLRPRGRSAPVDRGGAPPPRSRGVRPPLPPPCARTTAAARGTARDTRPGAPPPPHRGWSRLLLLPGVDQLEPVEPVGTEGDEVGQRPDLRERDATEHLHRCPSLPAPECELGGLGEAAEVVHTENGRPLGG